MTTFFREHCSRCNGKGSTKVEKAITRTCDFGTCTQTDYELVKQRCATCLGHGYLVLKLYQNKKNTLDTSDLYDYSPHRYVRKKFIAVKVNGGNFIYEDWNHVRRILSNNLHAKWKVFNTRKNAWIWMDPFKYPPNGQKRFITDYMK